MFNVVRADSSKTFTGERNLLSMGMVQNHYLTRRRFLALSAFAAGSTLGTSALLAACDSAPAISSTQPIELQFFHWIATEAGPTIAQINKLFHQENPHISITFSSVPTDQYQTVIKARLAGGDAPDVFGVYPGTKKDPFVKAGYVADLSDQPWVSHLQGGAKGVASHNGKVYALPMDQNAIGVIYNKQIFKQLKLPIPTSWQDFLNVCEKIKSAGITPLALGNKTLWVDQLIPYAMAPSAIFRHNSNFDLQMDEGKATFAGSAWSQMMEDYLFLNKSGYFNAGTLDTTFEQTAQLVASGKAAMLVQGQWALVLIEGDNPSIQLGMFPLPYAEPGQPIWVSTGVGTMAAVSSTTPYPMEARKYLQFWARPDIMRLYLKEKKAYSTFVDISNPALDPAAQEIESAFKVGTYNFLDQKWPDGPQDTLQKDIQGVFAGRMSISQMLQNMDKSFQANKASLS